MVRMNESYIPSPHEIRAACQQIQDTWTEDEHKRRCKDFVDASALIVPFVDTRTLAAGSTLIRDFLDQQRDRTSLSVARG